MFELEYGELALAVDLIAECIRALGFPAPGTYRQSRGLKKFTVPTLVIHGDSDAIVPIEHSGKRAAAAIAGSKLVVTGGRTSCGSTCCSSTPRSPTRWARASTTRESSRAWTTRR